MAKVPPRNPNYSAADLWPPGSKGVEFPPAAFHPIYLGNFLCQNYAELVPRVQQYFASKGLLARMVFSRNADSDPIRSYQDKTKLYDCLVYFTRPEDAQDAVKYLHRDKYFGHRLNIFPGRLAVPMDATLSVGYVLAKYMFPWPETRIEDHIECCSQTRVKESRKLTEDRIIVQYTNPDQLAKAMKTFRHLKTFPLTGEAVHYQRFLESEVIEEIRVRVEQTATFMAMRPEQYILDAFYVGLIPDIPSIMDEDMDVPLEEKKSKWLKKKKRKNTDWDDKFYANLRRQDLRHQQEASEKNQVLLPWQVAMQDGEKKKS